LPLRGEALVMGGAGMEDKNDINVYEKEKEKKRIKRTG
jgi:hypothetical protein